MVLYFQLCFFLFQVILAMSKLEGRPLDQWFGPCRAQGQSKNRAGYRVQGVGFQGLELKV